MSSDDMIRVTRADDGVVTLELDRPRYKNAMPIAGWQRLASICRELTTTPDDRAVVLTGAGGTFCAGADLAERSTLPQHASMRIVVDACAAFRNLPLPTIAAVSGDAVGAGFNLALCCDLVVADADARFSQIYSRRGLSVDFGGSWLLTHNVGLQRAKELAFFGRLLSAPQLWEMGLLNRVVEPGTALVAAHEWAHELLTLAPTALAHTKELLNAASSASFEASLLSEAAAQHVNITTPDTKEAIAAFMEKRAPDFSRRRPTQG